MRFSDPRRRPKKKLLLLWDGTVQLVRAAEQAAAKWKDSSIHAVLALPHESIHSYGSMVQSTSEPTTLERRLHDKFKNAIRLANAKRIAKFEIVYGDQITEVARLAKLVRAKAILSRRLEQSSFSKWIHRDLNERLKEEAYCPVFFLDSQSPTIIDDRENSNPTIIE